MCLSDLGVYAESGFPIAELFQVLDPRMCHI